MWVLRNYENAIYNSSEEHHVSCVVVIIKRSHQHDGHSPQVFRSTHIHNYHCQQSGRPKCSCHLSKAQIR